MATEVAEARLLVEEMGTEVPEARSLVEARVLKLLKRRTRNLSGNFKWTYQTMLPGCNSPLVLKRNAVLL